MYGRTGLDRFKKAQSSEPFSVTNNNSARKTATLASSVAPSSYSQVSSIKPVVVETTDVVSSSSSSSVTGGGQSSWQPPDWAIEPRPGVYYLEVLKEGIVLDRINLDRRRHIFGRQIQTCDFVLDHTSVSRQHAAVVPHKNGSIYVVDLGSAHGTFVANERLTKNSPVELEAGQSLRFAASTRTYILRKNEAALFPPPISPTEIKLPPSPDPSDEEAILTYNTFLNRYGLTKSKKRVISADSGPSSSGGGDDDLLPTKRATKRLKKMKVAFRDQVGGELIEVVGFSDGADVETEPGPVGVKEGSLVGKYASLVQTTVIPKGKEETSAKETNITKKGVTDKLQQVLNKVKNVPKSGGDLYGDSFSGKVGSSWAYSSVTSGDREALSPAKEADDKATGALSGKLRDSSSTITYDDDDDLFGD